MPNYTKVAVVTGANQGIGLAITKALCREFNGDVLLTSRNAESGAEAIEKLNEIGLYPKYHQLEIDNLTSVEEFKNFLVQQYGGLDILVNNAGVAYSIDSSKPSLIERTEHTMNVNFFSLIDICNELFSLLRAHARVVNLSSSAGVLKRVHGQELKKRLTNTNLTEDQLRQLAMEYVDDVRQDVQIEKGWPTDKIPTSSSAYSMSKVAVTALSIVQQRAFDCDSREDLIVNAVHPGYCSTAMTEYKGPLTVDQGAEAPIFAALLPENSKIRGQMIWNDKRVVNWAD